MLEAEHQQRNLRRTGARERLRCSLKSLVLSFVRACGKTTHAAALPPCREKKATGEKLLLELSFCSSFIPSTPRANGVRRGCVWGARRTHPAASAPSPGDAGVPQLGTLLCSLQPHPPPRPKNEIFSSTAKVSCTRFNVTFGSLHPDSELPYPGIGAAALRSSCISGQRVCSV